MSEQKEAEKQRIKDALTNQAQEIDRFLKNKFSARSTTIFTANNFEIAG